MKQTEFEFGNRPGELELFGPAPVAPEPFTVPELSPEDERALIPEPEPVDLGPDRWKGTYWEGGRDWSDWHNGPTTPEPLDVDRCSPSVSERMRRWDIPDNGTFHIRARGYCRCGWIGPERTLEADRDYDAAAWFDALDHAYAGWRDTPALPWLEYPKGIPYLSGPARQKAERAAVALLQARGYPVDWIGRKDAPTRWIRPATDDPMRGRGVIPGYGAWGNLAIMEPHPSRQTTLLGGGPESES